MPFNTCRYLERAEGRFTPCKREACLGIGVGSCPTSSRPQASKVLDNPAVNFVMSIKEIWETRSLAALDAMLECDSDFIAGFGSDGRPS